METPTKQKRLIAPSIMLVWLLTLLAGTALILLVGVGMAIWEGKPLDLGTNPSESGLILVLLILFAGACSLPAMIILALLGLAVDSHRRTKAEKYATIMMGFMALTMLTEIVISLAFSNGRSIWEEPLPLLMAPYAVAGLVLLHIMLRKRL